MIEKKESTVNTFVVLALVATTFLPSTMSFHILRLGLVGFIFLVKRGTVDRIFGIWIMNIFLAALSVLLIEHSILTSKLIHEFTRVAFYALVVGVCRQTRVSLKTIYKVCVIVLAVHFAIQYTQFTGENTFNSFIINHYLAGDAGNIHFLQAVSSDYAFRSGSIFINPNVYVCYPSLCAGVFLEYIRLAAVINKTRQYFDVILAHTGQNYDYNLNGVFFKDLGLEDPEVYLNAVGEDLGETCGNIIAQSYKLMNQIKPDAVLVLGDTNSCLSVIGAKRLHIPIFHMEAGNRCKDECLPEETNRRIVDIISDVNMAYSEHARRYLADCGLPKERTYVTGSPMAEVLHNNLSAIEESGIHKRLGLEKGKYILLSAHREENIDTEKNFLSLFNAINKMAEKYDMPILYSCHPRSRKRIESTGFKLDPRVIQHEPLGFHDYNCLQMNAFAVVSDSGTLPEESSFFTSVGHPFPAICIRTSTERPEALDKACFILSGIDEKGLLQSVDTAVEMNKAGDYGIPVPDYIEENVSTKVVKIIQSYTGVVNKMVWRKDI